MDLILVLLSALNSTSRFLFFSSCRSQLEFHLHREASLEVLPTSPRELQREKKRKRETDFVFHIWHYEKILGTLRINIVDNRSTKCRMPFPCKWPRQAKHWLTPRRIYLGGKKCCLQEQYQMLDLEGGVLTFEGYRGRYRDLRAGKEKAAEQSSFRSDFTY